MGMVNGIRTYDSVCPDVLAFPVVGVE